MTFVGHHRSKKLAKRARKKHEIELNASVKILSRRNRFGRYSARGHTFVFETEEKKLFEWLVVWTYTETGKALGFIATARTEDDALSFVHTFMTKDPNAKNIVRANFKGWIVNVARGDPSHEKEGTVLYREVEE